MQYTGSQERKILTSAKQPVYVVHGEYEFLQKELAGKILRYLLPEDEMDTGLQRIDGGIDHAMDKVVNATCAPSLFGGTQVVFVSDAGGMILKKNPDASGKKKPELKDKYVNYYVYEKLLEAIESPNDDTYMIFLCNETVKRPGGKTGVSRSEKALDRCYTALDKAGAIIEFPRMYDNDLLMWIKGRANMLGIEWSQETAEMFMEKAGKDVRHIVNELEKISIYFQDGEKVDQENMRKLITSSEDFFVNMLIDLMLEGRVRAALVTMEMSFKSGTTGHQIVAMVSARLRQLWQARYLLDKGYFSRVPKAYGGEAKNAVSRAQSEVKPQHVAALSASAADSIVRKAPFAVFQLLKFASNYTLDEIEASLRRMAEVDHKLKAVFRPKTGTDDTMLQLMVADISSGTILEAGPTG